MKKLAYLTSIAALMTVLVVGVEAQVKKGKTRPLTTKQLMSGLVKPNCGGIGEGLKEAPANDEAWEALATKAALLNEASYTLMDDGRCPDGTWADAAKVLREGSAALLAKLEAKDHAGAQAELGNMTKSCGACHKAHKK